MKVNNQKSGDSSVNLQAGRDNNLTVIVTSLETIVEGVKQSVLGEVSQKANEIAEQRVQEYLKNVEERITKKRESLPNYAENIDTPDFQYIARKTILTAARTESPDLQKILTGLLEGRLDATAELKKIAFNQSIESIDKLTSDHLKIISLVFLLRHIIFRDIVSWETFTAHLQNRIGKFIDFKNTQSQFQYLNYSGHCRTSVLHFDFFDGLKKTYAFLFQEPVEKARIEDLPTIKEKIMPILGETKNEEGEDTYLFRLRNETELKDFLKKNDIKDNEGEGQQLINLYNQYASGSTKGLDHFIEKTGGKEGIGQKIVDVVKGSKIEATELTLVGIVTAVTNVELICGEKINIDEWIEA